jgi:hypothetical protein
MTDLDALVDAHLRQPVSATITAVASAIQQRLGGDALLFYGSGLRGDDLEGVLDFYVLHEARTRHSWASALLWPDVSYHELSIGGRIIRAKVATMTLAIFRDAARGQTVDTTIWTRFAQPSRLVWSRAPKIADLVQAAVADCVLTASRFAAAIGPSSGRPRDYWAALFMQTYGAEFRIEKEGRHEAILRGDPAYYDAALPLAWRQLGLIAGDGGDALKPALEDAQRRQWLAQWRRRKWAGKPLNMLRLLKAAWTFEGAARYAVWKIERHSGVHIPLTPWGERHPVLAAPGVLLHLWRAARS